MYVCFVDPVSIVIPPEIQASRVTLLLVLLKVPCNRVERTFDFLLVSYLVHDGLMQHQHTSILSAQAFLPMVSQPVVVELDIPSLQITV